ncbi:MAG: ABC transporter ATP-binding protein [Lachnospiraceae bacterium]|nr:ABC transporter ATP-binding protein [Lachnospiraceae bacterium]
MIEIKNVTKKFDELVALKNISAEISEGQVFGLIGTNGAGKSTLMRTICGVYRPEEGEVLVDGEPVFENPSAKSKVFYISDDQFFFANGTPIDMMHYYETMYPGFNQQRFLTLMETIKLDVKRKINTFSKGMRKQLSVMLGVSVGAKYLLCDETFDGLDPVIRQAIKGLFIKEMAENGMTPVIASHNLRELEDICDHVGLLHEGGILFSKDLDAMKLGLFKLQCVLQSQDHLKTIAEHFPILQEVHTGMLTTLTLRGNSSDIAKLEAELAPVFWELLPLTLEEIFISEMEVKGYDFSKIHE